MPVTGTGVPNSVFTADSVGHDWQPDAQDALKKDVPFFVRPAVRKRVEAMAAEAGLDLIELDFYSKAKASMAPK